MASVNAPVISSARAVSTAASVARASSKSGTWAGAMRVAKLRGSSMSIISSIVACPSLLADAAGGPLRQSSRNEDDAVQAGDDGRPHRKRDAEEKQKDVRSDMVPTLTMRFA